MGMSYTEAFGRPEPLKEYGWAKPFAELFGLQGLSDWDASMLERSGMGPQGVVGALSGQAGLNLKRSAMQQEAETARQQNEGLNQRNILQLIAQMGMNTENRESAERVADITSGPQWEQARIKGQEGLMRPQQELMKQMLENKGKLDVANVSAQGHLQSGREQHWNTVGDKYIKLLKDSNTIIDPKERANALAQGKLALAMDLVRTPERYGPSYQQLVQQALVNYGNDPEKAAAALASALFKFEVPEPQQPPPPGASPLNRYQKLGRAAAPYTEAAPYLNPVTGPYALFHWLAGQAANRLPD